MIAFLSIEKREDVSEERMREGVCLESHIVAQIHSVLKRTHIGVSKNDNSKEKIK
jgi:hypothetical protein